MDVPKSEASNHFVGRGRIRKVFGGMHRFTCKISVFKTNNKDK